MRMRFGLCLVWVFLAVGCGGGDCENPNPNYDPGDPASPICFDGVPVGSPSIGTGGDSSDTVLGQTVSDGSSVQDTLELEQSDAASESDTTGEESTLNGSGYCASNPATEPGTLCASIRMPEDAEVPEKVSFHFFSVVPPMGPPTLMGLELASASELAPFVPGAEVPVFLENLPSEGELFLSLAVYMPGGGATTWIVVSGVDYVESPETELLVTFTGEPINRVEPIELVLAP